MSGLFICYEKVKPGFARITNTCSVVEHESYAEQLTQQGTLFHFVPMDGFSGFFELDGQDNVVAIDTRSEFPTTFDKTTIAILESATIKDVPPVQVEVAGGLVHSTVQHGGGDLVVRFALPGEYTVSFEAFPALRHTVTLTVQSQPAK